MYPLCTYSLHRSLSLTAVTYTPLPLPPRPEAVRTSCTAQMTVHRLRCLPSQSNDTTTLCSASRCLSLYHRHLSLRKNFSLFFLQTKVTTAVRSLPVHFAVFSEQESDLVFRTVVDLQSKTSISTSKRILHKHHPNSSVTNVASIY